MKRNEAYLVDNRIKLYFPYNAQLMDRIKSIKGRQWHPLERAWSVPAKEIDLVEKFGFNVDEIRQQTEEDKKQKVIDYKDYEDFVNMTYPFLYKHQVECVVRGIVEENLVIGDVMGLGKTYEALGIAQNFMKKIIVFCPASIKHQWKEEAKKRFNMELQVIEGTPKQRLYNHKNGIILNYELLSRDYKKIFNYSYGQTVIFDEASYLKNDKAQRTIQANKLRPAHKLSLTGTPFETKLKDGFNIGNLTVPGWMSKQEFYDDYCLFDEITAKHRDKRTGKDVYKRINVVVGYTNIDKFMKRFSEISIRRLKEDVLELPPKTVYKREIPLSTQQRKLEKAIKDELKEARIEEFVILAILGNGVELLSKSASRIARNVKDGHILTADSPKLRELLQVEDELSDKKIVIFTRFKKMQPFISDALGDDNCIIGNGDTKDKLGLIKEFEKKDARYLVVTDAFSYGVDIPFATGLINFDIPWNHARLKQREDRIHRMSSKSPVTIINFVSEGMEEYIYNKMMQGSDLAEKFNDTVRGFIRR